MKHKLMPVLLFLVGASWPVWAGTGGQDLGFGVEPSIALTVPLSLSWTLSVGPNISPNQQIIVESNDTYGIAIRCDTVANTKMLEHNGFDYETNSPKRIDTVFQFKEISNANYTDVATTDQVFVSGAAEPGATHTINFRQAVGFNDAVLPVDKHYHINIYYTATQGW